MILDIRHIPSIEKMRIFRPLVSDLSIISIWLGPVK